MAAAANLEMPPDPSKPEGQKVLAKRTVDGILEVHPNADRRNIALLTKWKLETYDPSRAEQGVTVESLGLYLDKYSAYTASGGRRRDPDMHIKRVLEAMHEQPGINNIDHYVGQIQLTRRGTPKCSNHNKDINITANGVFTILGHLISDEHRVEFLNHVFAVMQKLNQLYQQMKDDFKAYMEQHSHNRVQRHIGVAEMLTQASEAMEVSYEDANNFTLSSAHKFGYKCFFQGQGASEAMRSAQLLKPNEKPGVVHRLFSNHGLIADQFRLSTYGQAIRVQQETIQGLPTQNAKKRKVNEIINHCTENFQTNGTFNIPGASKKQNTKAFFDKSRIVQRRRA